MPDKSTDDPFTTRARVGDALDLLHRVLFPYIEREMRMVYGPKWVREARTVLHGKAPETWDTSDLLTLLYTRFHQVFRDIGHEGRSWVSLLREVRKRWAHQGALSLDETRRTLETAILLLQAVGAETEANSLEPHVLALMREEVQARVSPSPDAGATRPPAPAEKKVPEEGPTVLNRGVKKMRALFTRPSTEPLEMRRNILDAVEHAAEPYRKAFSFNRLQVHVLAPDERTRLLYETALGGQSEPFERAVSRRLSDARIPVPGSLNVTWRLYRTPPQRLRDRFEEEAVYVELQKRRISATATLDVLKGKATRSRYVIRGQATIGRRTEVTDDRGRIVWRNTVAFLDYDDEGLKEDEQEILATVSRVHARIVFDEAGAHFRIHDDQSTCGTSVVREGVLVPFQVNQQPVGLQDGDLIYFGKACVRFRIGRAR